MLIHLCQLKRNLSQQPILHPCRLIWRSRRRIVIIALTGLLRHLDIVKFHCFLLSECEYSRFRRGWRKRLIRPIFHPAREKLLLLRSLLIGPLRSSLPDLLKCRLLDRPKREDTSKSCLMSLSPCVHLSLLSGSSRSESHPLQLFRRTVTGYQPVATHSLLLQSQSRHSCTCPYVPRHRTASIACQRIPACSHRQRTRDRHWHYTHYPAQ